MRSLVALVRLAQLDWDVRSLVLIGDIHLVKEAKDYSHVACRGIRGPCVPKEGMALMVRAVSRTFGTDW